MENIKPTQKPNLVTGKISNAINQALPNLVVQIFNRDMRSEQLLADTITDKEGKYAVEWQQEQLGSNEHKTADIAVKVFSSNKKTLLYAAGINDIRFNASAKEEINITILAAIKSDEAEFDYLVKKVTALADKVAIANLHEDDTHQDISFLSKEIEVPAIKIEHLVVAHRLQEHSKIDAAFFYALLRKDTLLHSDFTKTFRARLSINIDSEIETLLYDAALTDPKKIVTDVKAAVTEEIVDTKISKECNRNIELLQRYRKAAEAYYAKGGQQKLVDSVIGFVLNGKIAEAGKHFSENKTDLNVFFEKISSPSFANSGTPNPKLHADLEKLFGLNTVTNNDAKPNKKTSKQSSPQKLAKLNKAGWVEKLTAETSSKKLSSAEKDAISLTASSMVRQLEKAFPTTAFTAQLARAEKPVLQNQKNIVDFLNKHEDFDLTSQHVDSFLKEKKVSKKDSDAIAPELNAVQRIFQLNGHFGKTMALRSQGFTSSQSIVAAGQTRFVNEIAPKAGIDAVEAKQIFSRASNINTAAMLVAGELQHTVSAIPIAALETTLLEDKLKAVSKDFPNLKSLFKSGDTCACEHCRSVYSPAAYMVEALQFLENRSVVDITVPPPASGIRPPVKMAQTVLFERRPDLGEIDLSCENANTPVKYIDLVCEVLEEAIAPDAGIVVTGPFTVGTATDPLKGKISTTLLLTLQGLNWPVTKDAIIYGTENSTGTIATAPYYVRDKKLVAKIIEKPAGVFTIFRLRQTLSSAEELAAAPEYINENAYSLLRNNEFAFTLPFDLNHVEGKAYFDRFGISRAKLMEDFQKPFKPAIGSSPAVLENPLNETIASEKLGLTDSERNIIHTKKLTITEQQAIWRAPSSWPAPVSDGGAPVSGDVLDYIKRVDNFLIKTGLSFKQLDLLLSLRFIDPEGTKLPTTTIDFTKALFIKNKDLSCNTDKKEIANLDIVGLDKIHRFLRLQKKTGWGFEVLDEIISQPILGNNLLNNSCLIKAATLVDITETTGIKIEELIGCFGEIPHRIIKDDIPAPLYFKVFVNKAKNGSVEKMLLPENVNGTELLTTYTTSIAVCLQMKETDLLKLFPTLLSDKIDFTNLSHLYASSRLIKKLKLSVVDFNILKELTGINIFASPQDMLDFVHAVNRFKKSPLKASDVKFMLRHEAVTIPDIEPKAKQILEKLQKEYQSNYSLNKSKFDVNLTAEEQKETLQNELSKLNGVDKEDIQIFNFFIDGTWTSATSAKSFVDEKLFPTIKTDNIKLAIDELDSVLLTKITDIETYESDLVALAKAKLDLKIAVSLVDIATATAAKDAAESSLLVTRPKYHIASGKNLMQSFLDAIADFQIEQGKHSILEQNISTAFKTDDELTKTVLKYAVLKNPTATIQPLLSILLQTDDLIHKINVIPVLPSITTTSLGSTFLQQFGAIKLLAKLIPLINAFKLKPEEVEWYFENNQTLGWLEWDSIPYDSAHASVDYSKFIDFTEIVNLSKQFTPVTNPADDTSPISFLSVQQMLLDSSTTKVQFTNTVALLSGYDNNDIDDIDAYFFSPFSIDNYRDVNSWNQLFTCCEDLRKLGTDIAHVENYIKPVLNLSDVSTLRSSLKAKYDESTWLSTLKEIMDVIRPQKRNALVAFILATNKHIKDENDLYDYFLVDVQMESCMPSSRIVMAHGIIQLFVQRCLMGLEPKAAADLETDKSWAQWKWMKNYRVWEANRKVFLYPENWLSPDLRDDKSYLFTEFENELQQNELTDFTAEEALIKYLEKLDNIAFLEVMATWYQTDIKTMHVFARTKGGDPAIYYYRRFEQERYWTPWEKVELDITGDHLLAFVRNNRLTLAWPVFSEVPNSTQKATVPNSAPGEVEMDKPSRKLNVQIAVSEFANRRWQPKKISKEGISTEFTKEALPRDIYNMIYFEYGEQIWFYTAEKIVVEGNREKNIKDDFRVKGIFDITGCKGYPELYKGNYIQFNDFLPDFNDTALTNQRYNEINTITGDDLSVKNGVSFYAFINLLRTTPGNFRISYPHQFTKMDLVSLILQMLFSGGFGIRREKFNAKIPLGTMLPYFMEDSKHAYVIIPGFYDKDEKSKGLVDINKKTGSNVLRLIEMVEALINGVLIYQENPTDNLLKTLMDDFQKIVTEISSYKGLSYGEAFKNMYHPLVCALRSTLYKDGVDGLMKREVQMQQTKFNFQNYYNPNAQVVPLLPYKTASGSPSLSYPIEDVDFESNGSYSGYNWELFFHAPFLLATKLTKNQRFEESMKWFHYIFNPTGALAGNTPQKYWVTKPFFLNQETDYLSQRIDNLLTKVASNATTGIEDLKFAITQWRNKSFMPDVVARFRPVAYQKAVLMKYIDNLIEWGDYLFRQDTMESIVQATQMYILADKILGEKPRTIPPVLKPPYETYNQVKQKLDAFGNALISLENLMPNLSDLPEHGNELPSPAPVTLSMLYFCIPQNDNMLEYWDRIADRLFKIRHCQNIDGIERSLALFAPPIDPGMLVRAAAAGLDISSVIAGINAPTPYYRFNVLSQKANELAQEVRGLGSSLLQALEKKDAEAMSLLRSEMEIKVLNAVKDMKELQIKESTEQIEILKRTKKVTEERQKYYSTIERISSKEKLNLDKMMESHNYQVAAQGVKLAASIISLLPDIDLGASGFGGSPIAKFKLGGLNIGQATNAASDILSFLGMLASNESSRASIIGGYERRYDDWKLQERTAILELKSIDRQLIAAEIRKEIAETDLKNHELQIENAKKSDEFMRTKFTNKELYDWMVGQISSVYFSAYKLSYDFAKKAERSYRFELGNDDSFIKYGYWDSMKKGLGSADHLIHDIKRMETSYLDNNKREYELTKHISLSMLDPLALIKLRATGVCDFDLPEVLYDMDHAGHYFRRIKSVSISLPCIAGPYTSVSAKLSLVNNRYRKNGNQDNAAATGYTEDADNDERFVYNIGAIQSIAASSSQNDSGVFELNFRDERYLPFEGTGAISSWRLELPTEIMQYDYNTIADVVMHVKYTAREGGSGLKTLANNSLKDRLQIIKQQLSAEGLHIAINMKHEMPNEWQMLKKSSAVKIKIDKTRLPYFVQTIVLNEIEIMYISNEAIILNSNVLKETNGIFVSTNSKVNVGDEVEIISTVTELTDLIIIVKYNLN